MATFLTQIIFINTLIAILGDTYGRIMENKQKYALKQRAKVYSDYLHIIIPSENLCGANFVYIVKPKSDDDSSDDDDGISEVMSSI